MNEQERAEEHLRTIRRLMERGTIYRAISAPTALVGGVLSLAASAFGCSHPVLANDCVFVIPWLLVLLLTAGTNTLFIVLGAKKRDEPVFSASMKAALIALAPPFIVAGVLTAVLFGLTGTPLDAILLSVIWSICYGLGLLATSHFAPRSLTLLGWAFLLASLAALTSIRYAPTSSFGSWTDNAGAIFMAATFGLFHLIYATCAWPRKGAELEP